MTTRHYVIALCVAAMPASGICQEPGHKFTSRLPGDMLAQLSDSLEQLASRWHRP